MSRRRGARLNSRFTPEGQESLSSVASDSVEVVFLRVGATLIAFGTSVVVSRSLGPEGRGEYYLPVVAAATVGAFAKLGLDQANVYLFATRGISADRLSRQNSLVALVAGGLMGASLLLAPVALPGVFSGTPMKYLVLAALTLPFALHTQFQGSLLNLVGRVGWPFRAALIASSAQLVLLLVLVAMHELTVPAVLMANLLFAVATWYLTNRIRIGSIRPSWDTDLLSESLRHGFLLNLGMAFLFLHLRVDMFMVKAIRGVSELGIYSLAVVLAETVLLITDSTAIALLPRQVRREPASAAAFALEGARASMGLGLVLLAGGLLVGRPAIRFFFGGDFEPAFLPFACLLPGVVFLGMQRFTGAPLLMAGKTGLLTWVYAVSLALNVALNFVLIPRWGGAGAAVASSVSYSAGAMLFLGWTSRLAGVSMVRGLVPSKKDVIRIRASLALESHRLQARFKPGR